MDSILRVLKYSVSICIKIKSAVPADRPHTGATTLDLGIFEDIFFFSLATCGCPV